jgi:bacterioferritin (cytochrome b1)
MLLKQSDYKTIKKMFERVMKRQEEMNQKLSNHRKDLEVLGKALESAVAED